MNIDQLISSITPEIYQNMKQALELGKWADGRILEGEQRELCMEAIIRYENIHNVPADQRVGYIEQTCNSGANKDESDDPTLIKIINN